MITWKYAMEQILSFSSCTEVTEGGSNLWLMQNQVYPKINFPKGKSVGGSLLL